MLAEEVYLLPMEVDAHIAVPAEMVVIVSALEEQLV
jgi:hypothetical protein